MRTAFQYALGVVVFAILARAFFVMGFIVPVTVAGSSMAPTLQGPRVHANCPTCSAEFQSDIEGLPIGQIVCPECFVLVSGDAQSIVSGDSIWIDRTAFDVRPPRRWDIVVFQCPNDASRLCVKRVLGLPGERIAFRDGDLLINDVRIPKPLAIDYEYRHGDGIGQAEFDARQQCWQLGEGYFVVGDNQAVSLDSRNWPSGAEMPSRLMVGQPIGHF